MLSITNSKHNNNCKIFELEMFETHIKIIDEFIKWNKIIKNKETYRDFFKELDNVCQKFFNQKLRLQFTQEEFEKMQIESVRQLVHDALKDIRESIIKQVGNKIR